MMWTDYYLKFVDEAEFRATAPESLQAEVSLVHATDVIGTLFHYETHEALEGYHVNMRLQADLSLPETLQAFVITTPAMPKRVFA